MLRLITRVQIAYVGVFFAACVGVFVYQAQLRLAGAGAASSTAAGGRRGTTSARRRSRSGGSPAASRRLGPDRRPPTRCAPSLRAWPRLAQASSARSAGRPEHVGAALVVGEAGGDEQQVREPVEVLQRRRADAPRGSASATPARSARRQTVRARCSAAAAGEPPGSTNEVSAAIEPRSARRSRASSRVDLALQRCAAAAARPRSAPAASRGPRRGRRGRSGCGPGSDRASRRPWSRAAPGRSRRWSRRPRRRLRRADRPSRPARRRPAASSRASPVRV